MVKKIIEGGLVICLILGVMVCNYNNKMKGQESTLETNNLYASENQIGYDMSNFGVSISCEQNATKTEVLEFVIQNTSAKKWYWRRNIYFDEENERYEAKDLEVKIEDIWYNVPLKKDQSDFFFQSMQLHLLPNSATPISVWTGIYQVINPGNYRFTIVIYDDDFNEFNLSCEFTVTEGR